MSSTPSNVEKVKKQLASDQKYVNYLKSVENNDLLEGRFFPGNQQSLQKQLLQTQQYIPEAEKKYADDEAKLLASLTPLERAQYYYDIVSKEVSSAELVLTEALAQQQKAQKNLRRVQYDSQRLFKDKGSGKWN
jgi:hypothetical protein